MQTLWSLLLFSRSVVPKLFTTPWTTASQASLSFTLGTCSNSCPLSQWCHPTITSSVTPFSCPQSFPACGPSKMAELKVRAGRWGKELTKWLPKTPFFWDVSEFLIPLPQDGKKSRLFSENLTWKGRGTKAVPQDCHRPAPPSPESRGRGPKGELAYF